MVFQVNWKIPLTRRACSYTRTEKFRENVADSFGSRVTHMQFRVSAIHWYDRGLR